MGEESGRRPSVAAKTVDVCGLQQALVSPRWHLKEAQREARRDSSENRSQILDPGARCSGGASVETTRATRKNPKRRPSLASAQAGGRHRAPLAWPSKPQLARHEGGLR